VVEGLARVIKSDAPDLSVTGVASTAGEAEDLIERLQPDVVLMDIYLPGTSGIEVTRRMHAKYPDLKIIMFTVSDEQDDLYESLKAGATGYVTKTQGPSAVIDVVRDIARGNCAFPAYFVQRLVDDLETSRDPHLTAEENEVLAGIGRGETYPSIASRLHISTRTVRRRMESIYRKLRLKGRQDALRLARNHSDAEGPIGQA
jgi:DNA-binding NarL/FixJ family response regulator